MKKNENKKIHRVEEHKPWELETQTEGLDELQGERIKKEGSKPSKIDYAD